MRLGITDVTVDSAGAKGLIWSKVSWMFGGNTNGKGTPVKFSHRIAPLV